MSPAGTERYFSSLGVARKACWCLWRAAFCSGDTPRRAGVRSIPPLGTIKVVDAVVVVVVEVVVVGGVGAAPGVVVVEEVEDGRRVGRRRVVGEVLGGQ